MIHNLNCDAWNVPQRVHLNAMPHTLHWLPTEILMGIQSLLLAGGCFKIARRVLLQKKASNIEHRVHVNALELLISWSWSGFG